MSIVDFEPVKVCELIAKTLPKKSTKNGVLPAMDLRNDLGVDSIGLMTIVFTLEEDLGVDLFSCSDRFVSATTVDHVIDIVREAMENEK